MKFRFRFFMLICYIQDVFSLTTIETIPPTQGNLLATNYSGVVVRATFEKTTSSTNCGWRYDGDTIAPLGDVERFGGLQFHIVGIGCVNRTTSRQSITCVEREIDGMTHIITNLTYHQPLTSDLVLAVRCNNGADLIIALAAKAVQDCPHNFTNGVIASTSQFHFNTTGTFQCNNRGMLFYTNGSKASSLPSHTTCLYTAEWSGQEAIQDLQCWTDPETKISTEPILNVNEGENLTITCQYTSVVPSGDSSIIYFNGNAVVIAKDEMFIIPSLQRDDDKKQISCQAVTPYTEMYNATGRSPNYTINVQYISDRIVAEVFLSSYLIESEIGYLIQSGQVITINCSSDGNPEPQCAFSVCLDMICMNVTSNTENDCVINQTITQDVSFSCIAFNKAGSLLSDSQNITAISKSRSVNVAFTGNLTKTKTLTKMKGEELDLTCSIDHADILNTSFLWKYGSGKEQSFSKLNLPSLRPVDRGNYTCITQDSFGVFSTTIYVDVIYAPFVQPPLICILNVNENGTCEVKFMSNPSSSFISVIKDNTGVGIYTLMEGKAELISKPNFEQVFSFKIFQVTLDDAGTYVLNLTSSVPPYNYRVTFDIKVVEEGNNPIASQTLVIALSAAGGAFLLLVVAVLLWRCKRWENKGKMEGGTSSHENQAFQEDGPASKEKEEKSNTLYATSAQADATEPAYDVVDEPAYEVVDQNRKKKQKPFTEKEEKLNPLYVSSSHTEEAEPAYGEVDKTAPSNKQAQHAQRASLQPANQTEETYAAVDRKKKKATDNQNNQTEQDSVYAEVRKPKKKKKRQITQQSEKSVGIFSPFDDVTLHGTTQQG